MPTLESSLTPETLVPMATFLAIMLGGWALLLVLSSRPTKAEDRLKRMLERPQDELERLRQTRERTRIQEKVAEAARRLSAPMQPKDEAELGKIRLTLLNAGIRSPQAVQIFLGMKMLSLLLGLALATPAALSKGFDRNSLLTMVAAGGIGFYLPGFVVSQKRRARQKAIFLGLPDALDLMVVCVEAGLGFDAAMRRVTAELNESCPEVCDELNIVNFQIQMGRPRREALRDLGIRTGVEDVRALAAVIIQAEKFGSPIGAALRVQSDAMRTRRRQMAEEKAAQTAVKIMLPLIMFIFPGVFVVLVGPAAIKIMDTMMNK
ncbi:type II secretion system F family protein [Tautonia plasticadhaerens]|uniref:Bacterial type II secretion system protein F domain protein n=1 Tax=Tautonia plasticadhaerens TaxID=2527974 RepID=A0A518H531_9BACT|nr:type II secretion system F family protein [Tautonia plasticadhaerens]QDV35950.1 Bacterial type II secretion system protein F domain protein [Tautonia plasticadhaerens]